MTQRTRTLWTFAITSIALFMVSLDNLVVSTAIPVIRLDLHASLEGLSWTVNAYTLTFAVLLLTGAALGDRFGRRRMFAIGVGIFTLASVAARSGPERRGPEHRACRAGPRRRHRDAPDADDPLGRRAARAARARARRVGRDRRPGDRLRPGRRRRRRGGLLVAVHLLAQRPDRDHPRAARPEQADRVHGPAGKLDLPGVGLVSAGMFGLVWGLIRGNDQGWTSPEIIAAFTLGALFVAAFVAWELRAPHPMLPMRFFRNAAFSLANLASLFMFFGMFGSIFLLTQFFQTVQGYSPLSSGLRILPWTLAPMFVAPVAGAMSDRISPKRILGTGLALQAIALAWIAVVSTPTTPYASLIVPFVMAGVGMALFFAPMANVVLSAVGRREEGQASGANNAIRELGGVFGVAVLASVFSRYGGYETGQTFVDGMTPALWIGAIVVGLGAVAAFAIPSVRRQLRVEPEEELVTLADAA